MNSQPAENAQPIGVRAIVIYKATKAALQLLLAAVIVSLWPFGLPDYVQAIANELRHQITHAWATQLAALLVGKSVRMHLAFAATALTFDAALTGVEAWALASGRWWGPWLIVVATSTLIPFEVVALVHALHLVRLLLLIANVLVVIYLARRAWQEHVRRAQR